MVPSFGHPPFRHFGGHFFAKCKKGTTATAYPLHVPKLDASPRVAASEADAALGWQFGPGFALEPLGHLGAIGIDFAVLPLGQVDLVHDLAVEHDGDSWAMASFNQVLGSLIENIDAFPVIDPVTGKIGLRLVREGEATVAWDEDDFTDPPDMDAGGWECTYNLLTVRFTNRDKAWTADGVSFRDRGNFALTGSQAVSDLPARPRRRADQRLSRLLGADGRLVRQGRWGLCLRHEGHPERRPRCHGAGRRLDRHHLHRRRLGPGGNDVRRGDHQAAAPSTGEW